MEGGATDPKQVFTANANQPVREQFRPSSTKQVSGLSVATSASVGGQLRWRIVENGTELVSGAISQWSPNYRVVTNKNRCPHDELPVVRHQPAAHHHLPRRQHL